MMLAAAGSARGFEPALNPMRRRPMPVVRVSSLPEAGAEVTLDALALGNSCKAAGALLHQTQRLTNPSGRARRGVRWYGSCDGALAASVCGAAK